MKSIVFSLLFVFAFIPFYGQILPSKVISKSNDLRFQHIGGALSLENFFRKEYEPMGLNSPEDMQYKRSFDDNSPVIHHRYEQLYKGLPVVGGSYTLHTKDDVLIKAGGMVYPHIEVNTIPKIDQKKAVERSIDIAYYELGVESSTDLLIASEPSLCIIDEGYPEQSGKYLLAYEVTVQDVLARHYKTKYFINAHSGRVITSLPEIIHTDVIGLAKTRYYGDQTIHTDSLGPGQYRLYDSSRGGGIWTKNDADFAPEDFFDDDNIWDNINAVRDEVAGDAHYCTAAHFDFMNDRFGWIGADGVGSEMRTIVHAGGGGRFVNAFWNGSEAWFGDGDCDDYGPLTTLDVVGHEYAHGFTQHSSGLVYRNESGALNESMSDIFGKALEIINDPLNYTWYIGDRFLLNDDVSPFRSMKDPNERDDPKYYGGQFWYTNTGDAGGVHTNSGVLNYWFYLLVEGDTGVTERGVPFDVQPIGLDKAIDICYTMQVGYLTPSSNYLSALEASINSCIDLFGANSSEMASLLEAWKAVGLTPASGEYNVAIYLDEDFIFECDSPDSMSVGILLVHQGLFPYVAGESLMVHYYANGADSPVEEIILTSDFNPGDTIRYTFINKFENTDDSSYPIDIFLDTDDESLGDNKQSRRIYNIGTPGTDLRVTRIAVSDQSECNTTYGQVLLQPRLRNQGCEVIPQGTLIPAVVNIGSESFNIELEVYTEWSPNGTLFFRDTLDLLTPIFLNHEITMEIFPPNDLNTDNNTRTETIAFYATVKEGYSQNFTNFNLEENIQLNLETTSNHDFAVIDYNGQTMLGATRDDDVPSNVENCEHPDYFHSDNYGSASISFCVDVEDMEEPTLHFDLVQFRSDIPDVEYNPELTNSTKVYMQDGEVNIPLIFGQTEGSLIHHAIPIETGYTGIIEIEMSHLSGNLNQLELGDFSNGDYTLIDNLALVDGMVSVNDPLNENGYLVRPNPSYGEVLFEGDGQHTFDVKIYDIMGRLIFLASDNQQMVKWSDGNIPGGIYIYTILEDGRSVQNGRLSVQ